MALSDWNVCSAYLKTIQLSLGTTFTNKNGNLNVLGKKKRVSYSAGLNQSYKPNIQLYHYILSLHKAKK